jgi:ABC-type transport system involved in multi-copper enzyme maturation permease subunit
MNTVLALSSVVLKELYRRKDFYVLFVMTALITVVMGSVDFFHDNHIARYLKEICLLLIWVSALVIAIATAARQIPSERATRTIFPLLAKPVSRGQVIVGKFAGCWLATGLALVVFYAFFGVISASREHSLPLLVYFQAMWLQWFMLGIVVALALLGSVVFAAPSSNGTICFVAVIGILLLARYLHKLAVPMPEPQSTVFSILYFLIPHLEWYDVREWVSNDRGTLDWLACAKATVYAGVYIAMLLYATWMVFRRKPLNV